MADGLSKSRFKLPSRARWFEKKGMEPLSLRAGQYSLLPFLSLSLSPPVLCFFSHLPVGRRRLESLLFGVSCVQSRLAVSHARIKMCAERRPDSAAQGSRISRWAPSSTFPAPIFGRWMIYSGGRHYLPDSARQRNKNKNRGRD